MFRMKFISSLEKCFLDDDYDAKPQLDQLQLLRNERGSFCVAFSLSGDFSPTPVRCTVSANIPAKVEVYRVDHLPVQLAAAPYRKDDNYQRTGPGLYPDLLTPYDGGAIYLSPEYVQSLWIQIVPNEETQAGDYEVEVTFTGKNDVQVSQRLPVQILAAELPPQNFGLSQFIHCDCLAQYYDVPMFSNRHFEILEAFIATAVEYGLDTMLTPIVTPPLDTAYGGERMTAQLIGITVTKGQYAFDFALLDRWIDMCERQGIYRYEISYLFTQWGARHAPKIMAHVDGVYQRIFGWETDAFGEEYVSFLHQLLPAFIGHMNSRGIGPARMIFHVSDEPTAGCLENYRHAKEIVAPLMAGYEIYDSLSDIAFYQQGLVKHPIPAINQAEPFLEAGVPDLWVYYCVAQKIDVSNRFMSMPSARNRVIGTQFYKYNIAGFLHWGFNFYNSRESLRPIDPFREPDCGYFGPAGDAFSVYPGPDGKPLLSLRLLVFYDALQDLRAFRLCESLYSRAFVMDLIEEQGPISFKSYPKDAAYLLNLRRKINQAIADKIS